ncbi:MAG: tetratricopeptide repeat protein [Candidatus Omnitrophica bacterium]|nr:tetratricopeptide repeat protein [Candidatus Omnitrophota bacterium]MCM8801872.1 tetratricopeptide repeat protein [Candidatus Omnitrophota bacterium]
MIDKNVYLVKNIIMNKSKIFLIFLLLRFFSYSYWEWTPQTKKWINPKYVVQDTPKEQFEYAEQFRKNGEIETSIREHKKLLKHYPKSEYAASSCFILGNIYKEKGDYKKAFDYYQKIVEEYPSSSLVISAIKVQSEIAERNLKSGRRLFSGLFKNTEEKAEFMNKVIENSPYDIEAVNRMFKLANFYYELKEYDKSIEVLDKIIKNFSETTYEEEAKFLKIKYSVNSIPEASLDTDIIEDIKQQINEFLIEYPESRFKNEVKNIEITLNNKEAEKYYQIARYYEKAGKKKSAIYYYKKLITLFPDTKYGKIANEKISKGM